MLTERQQTALAHPCADPVQVLGAALWATEVLAGGNLLRTALTVDR